MLKTQASNKGMINPNELVHKSPIYYGWIILAIGTFGLIMTSPGQTFGVSVFLEHIIKDLGISRGWVSTLYTIGTGVGSLVLPIVGRQIDRRGARLMVVIIAALFGLACIYMGQVRNAVMLGFGFIAIRMLGQGSLSLVSMNVINQWWVRRRGTVMGISGLLFSLLGLGGIPLLINWLIPFFGWRTTYMIAGLALILVMAPLGYLFFRDTPEAYGLQPDGYQPAVDDEEADSAVSEENWQPAEAYRTITFWVAGLGIGSISMLSTGLFFHMFSIFEDNGLSPDIAAAVFVPIAITSALTNFGGGVLVDYIPPRVLLVFGLIGQTIILIMAQYLNSIPVAIIYGIILGTVSGVIGAVSSVIWPIYFGRKYLGSITGLTFTMTVVGAALGPMPLGIARDVFGSYNLALTTLAIIPLGFAIANLFFGKPIKN